MEREKTDTKALFSKKRHVKHAPPEPTVGEVNITRLPKRTESHPQQINAVDYGIEAQPQPVLKTKQSSKKAQPEESDIAKQARIARFMNDDSDNAELQE